MYLHIAKPPESVLAFSATDRCPSSLNPEKSMWGLLHAHRTLLVLSSPSHCAGPMHRRQLLGGRTVTCRRGHGSLSSSGTRRGEHGWRGELNGPLDRASSLGRSLDQERHQHSP